MKTRKPLLILAATAATLGAAGGTTAALAQSDARIDGDADVHGTRVHFEAETPQSSTRVTFLYGSRRVAGRVTDVDREDRTKEWEASTTAFRSDRRNGATITFRVRACDASDCTTTRFQKRDD